MMNLHFIEQLLQRTRPHGRTLALLLVIWLSSLSMRAALVGSTLEISGGGCRFPDVAYGNVSRKYLVVWADYNDGRIHGRLVAGNGVMSAGDFPISEGGALY